MIVGRVSAENVLRYARLDLGGLPARGVIAVEGLNESGKTAIAEILCFTLFGRTVSLPPEEIVKIIRWGQARCSARVDFAVGGQRYRIIRRLDGDGNQGVRLTAEGRDAPQARGVEGVGSALTKLLGWGFEELVESFYLPQRAPGTAEQHSAAIKAMAGVAALERVSAELEGEIRLHARTGEEIDGRITDVRQQIAGLDIREEKLPQLGASRRSIVAQQTAQTRTVAELAELSERLSESVSTVQGAAEALAAAGVDTSYRTWRERLMNLDRALGDVPVAPSAAPQTLTADLAALVRDLQGRLEGVETVRGHLGSYRRRLAALLGEPSAEAATGSPDDPQGSAPEPEALAPRLARTQRRRAWCWAGLLVSLLLAAAAGLTWGLLAEAPEAALSRAVAARVPPASRLWLLPAAAVAAGLVAGFGIASGALGMRARRLRSQQNAAGREAGVLDSLDSVPLPEAVTALQEIGDERAREVARTFVEGPGAELVESDALAARRASLRGLVAQYESATAVARVRIADERGAASRDLETQATRLADVDQSIAEEMQRRRADAELRAIVTELEARGAECERRRAARVKARELLAGACREVSRRFNHDVRTLVGRTLPLLTQGRYAHLQIDETLAVRVFSSEKRDFVDLDEVSSGTRRQIELAVRLALSERLVENTHGGPQFVFLDEPFALFDPERTRAALHSLPRVSDRIQQIWIAGQGFPEDAMSALRIRCAPNLDELIIAGL